MKISETLTTYEPDNALKKGYLAVFFEIGQELIENRWLTWQLFRRDFSVTYKQTFLGIFWPFILPVMSIGTFVILNYSGVFLPGDIDVPYPLYALLGMTFWQLFSAGLLGCSQSLLLTDQMLTRINCSKKSVVVASLGKTVIPCFIQLMLAMALLFLYHVKITAAVFWLPLVIAPALLLILGLGFPLALFAGITRDINNVLPISLTFMMFLTPVLYAKPEAGILAWITKINPFYYLIAAARDLILKGAILEVQGFILSAIASVMIFFFSILFFHLAETRIAERI